MSDEFKFQPSQQKAIETVQNEKSVSSILANGFVARWGTPMNNMESHLSRKLDSSITIATNGLIVS